MKTCYRCQIEKSRIGGDVKPTKDAIDLPANTESENRMRNEILSGHRCCVCAGTVNY